MVAWISQEKLDKQIRTLLQRIRSAYEEADKRQCKNKNDPFSSLILVSALKITDVKTLKDLQLMESTLRGASNAIGEFHQNVLGAVQGWQNHDAGYDLECLEKRILAEIKNKHNTMNASNRREIENNLRTALRQKKEKWDAYLVQIIPKKPVRFKKELSSSNLFEVDGATFYEVVTGHPNAIHDLFEYMISYIKPSKTVVDYCYEILYQSLPPRK